MTHRNSGRMVLVAGLLLAAGFVLSACSTPTATGSLVDASGKHPSNFVDTHPSYARPDGNVCTECHGDDLRGGISKVSCFSASRNGVVCHPAGPAFHPLDWLNKTSANFHGTAFRDNVTVRNLACDACHDPGTPALYNCLDCHFTEDGGRIPPGSPFVHGQITGHTTFGPLDTLNAVTAVCVRCHETNNSFGHMAQPFCHNCHSPAPAGFHPAGWSNPDNHGASAKAAPGPSTGFGICQNCHGNNFAGSGNAPTCVNNASCHGSGVASPHSPAPWRVAFGSPPTARRHTNTDNTVPGNPAACAWCHRGSGTVVITPPTPPPASPVPGCFNNTLCHEDVQTAPHPVRPYADHPADAQAQFNTFCNNCHNMDLPRILVNAPYCIECHKGGSPFTFTGCASCHGNPPAGAAPVDAVFPNIAGAHARHNALDNVQGVCNTCHNGGGTGTGLQHFYDNVGGASGIDVAFPNLLFKANSGNLLFTGSDNTCSNVSCHGGITTPGWRAALPATGDAACRLCHTAGAALGSPENNSPYSGLHIFHLATSVGGAVLCTECHNMANGTTGALNHFEFLNTAPMEGPASQTVQPNGSAANYNATNQTCGTFTCHTASHAAFSWSGGPNHPVPFTGASHTSVTSGTFAADCGTCHFETGAGTKVGPTCTVCHQAGSPLAAAGCTSCHAGPPNNASTTAYPNVAGTHAVHIGLNGAGSPVSCNTCHDGLGTGTLNHYNRANARPGSDALRVAPGDAAFLATYNAETGATTFSATTLACGNASCHGGQTTPNWQTGTIDVVNACLSCHASGTAQFNSYNSGRHTLHTNEFGLSAATCKRCHDATKVNVVGHFDALSTSAFEQTARSTLLTALQYNGTSCNPSAGGLTGCHGQETW